MPLCKGEAAGHMKEGSDPERQGQGCGPELGWDSAGTLTDPGSRPDPTVLWVSASSCGPREPEKTCESGQDSEDGTNGDLSSVLSQPLGLTRRRLFINKMGCWSSSL